MNETPRFLTTNGSLTIIWRDNHHVITDTHPNYEPILELFETQNWEELDTLLDIARTVSESLGLVHISENGEVTFDGRPVHNTLTERIFQFMQQGLPWKPLALFLENLMANPSKASVDELYDFLEKEGIAITPDGHFLAYKGVDAEFKDVFTHTFDNSVGAINEMPRNSVDDDRRRHCSNGFHVGSHEYATGWAGPGGNVVLVKVNPADAVSVPEDHDCQKLRVCRYEVVDLAPPAPLQNVLVGDYTESEDFDDEDEFDREPEFEHDDDSSCYGDGHPVY